MNDDEVLSLDESTERTEACDPDPASAPCREDADEVQSFRSEAENCEDASVSDADLQDPDPNSAPDSAAASQTPAGAELAELRGELNALREELRQERAVRTRLGAEYEEFQLLYPSTPLTALPDSVWEDVRRGIPIAAAFALAEKHRLRKEALAEESNLSNARRSSGAMKPTEPDYFSPDEVRAMSPAEVRKHYSQIRSSMKNWH